MKPLELVVQDLMQELNKKRSAGGRETRAPLLEGRETSNIFNFGDHPEKKRGG